MSFRLLIINYHYLRTANPASGIYPITPEEFDNQLSLLAKTYRFCSQGELLSWIRNKNTPAGKYCLLTFDDALAEQMIAFEIIKRRGIPAIFYIPAGPFINGKALAVHKLHYIRATLSDEDLYDLMKSETDIASYPFDYGLIRSQYRYDDEKAGEIKFYLNFILSDAEKNTIIDKLFNGLIDDELMFIHKFYMSEADLIKLASLDMLGSHGTDHRPLAMLSPSEITKDIGESLLYLDKLTSRKVRSFSYPYGSNVAVGEQMAHCFDGTSVEFALTMFRGINTTADLFKKYLLKRIDTNDAPGGKNPLPEFQG